jgi:hypothetical protein
MEAALIIKLITEVGAPLAFKLIELAQAGVKVTPQQWEELRQLGRYSSAEALAAARRTP